MMDGRTVWERNEEKRRLYAEKQIHAQQEANYTTATINDAIDRGINTLLPYIYACAAELDKRKASTDADTTALLTAYIEAEKLYISLLKERKSSLKRNSSNR